MDRKRTALGPARPLHLAALVENNMIVDAMAVAAQCCTTMALYIKNKDQRELRNTSIDTSTPNRQTSLTTFSLSSTYSSSHQPTTPLSAHWSTYPDMDGLSCGRRSCERG